MLGTSGLINAYRNATQDALQQGDIVEKLVEDVYRLTFGYDRMSDVMTAVKKLEISVLKQSFEEIAILEIAVRQSNKEQVFTMLKAYIAKVTADEAALIEDIPGLDIQFLFVT